MRKSGWSALPMPCYWQSPPRFPGLPLGGSVPHILAMSRDRDAGKFHQDLSLNQMDHLVSGSESAGLSPWWGPGRWGALKEGAIQSGRRSCSLQRSRLWKREGCRPSLAWEHLLGGTGVWGGAHCPDPAFVVRQCVNTRMGVYSGCVHVCNWMEGAMKSCVCGYVSRCEGLEHEGCVCECACFHEAG